MRSYDSECYFWSTYGGAELDLLVLDKGKKMGFEFKYMDAPKITKSMMISIQDLSLDSLYVIYPGDVDYALSETIQVKNLQSFLASHPKN